MGRTALLMPVYNEDPERVFTALSRMGLALAARGRCPPLRHLRAERHAQGADRRRRARGLRLAEAPAVARASRSTTAAASNNHHRKAGNIADFVHPLGRRLRPHDRARCRQRHERRRHDHAGPRHGGGSEGRHHPVAAAAAEPLDALCPHDAVRRPRLWPARRRRPRPPGTGATAITGATTPSSAPGPSREAAGLPELTGRKPFGGHVLSHDFVEAALIRRAGWAVYMLPQLAGSYEETPPSLIDLATRDRRWAQGNLQHMKIVGAKGLHWVSRVHLIQGIMSYLASPLWLMLLLAGLCSRPSRAMRRPITSPTASRCSRVWPVFDPGTGAAGSSPSPSACSTCRSSWPSCWRCATRNCARAAAASSGLLKSVLAESFVSMLLSPVMMLIQSRVVADVLLGPRLRLERPEPRRPGHAASATALEACTAACGWRASASPCCPSTSPGPPSCGCRRSPARSMLSPLVSWASGLPAFGRTLWHWNVFRIPEEAPARRR